MQIIDLFSGIGGFSLAGRWVGWHTVQFCEIDSFCKKVLAHHFPGVPISNDVKQLTYDEIKKNGQYDPAEPTIIVGGFPCQPFSAAGKRQGTDDPRHLWPEMLRIIREVQPDWVVGENVHGLLNWSGGLVFEQVQVDLEAAGYEVTSYVLPAAGVNAPHRRDRVWIVAKNTKCSGARSVSGSLGNKGGGTCEDRGESLRQAHGEIGTGGVSPASTDGTAKDTNSSRSKESVQQQTDILTEPSGGCEETTADTESVKNIGNGSGGFQPEFTGIDEQGATTDTDFHGCTSQRQGAKIERIRCENDGEPKIGGEQTQRDDGLSGFSRDAANPTSIGCVQREQGNNRPCEDRKAHRPATEGADATENTVCDGCVQREPFQERTEVRELRDTCTGGCYRVHLREGDATDTSDQGLQGRKFNGAFDEGGNEQQGEDKGQPCKPASKLHKITDWTDFPTQSPICDRNDGVSVGLVDITFPKWRNESIKALGNAIVPQVAYQIFKSINQTLSKC